MKCPVCRTLDLAVVHLDSHLPAFGCPDCGGNWLSSGRYHEWLAQHGPTLPEKPYEGPGLALADNQDAKLCPECRRILLRYRVGHGVDFTLDQCSACNGVWLDRNEWEALKGRNLHDEIHLIFTVPRQSQARQEESRKRLAGIYGKHFGGDYAEVRRIREWIDAHPEKQRILAYLSDPNPYKA